ncbi:MAG: glycosyltransferase family 4 protein [Lentisphaeria bacterium]|nr:glycosyltransferase family 4 protein [Lentisphaeria bacterium]
MRLAFIIYRYFPFGGLQLDFRRMLEEGIRRGHDITVLYAYWEGDRISGAAYQELPGAAFTNWGKMLAFERSVGEYLKTEKFDLTVGFNRMAGLDIYFAADNCFAESSRRKSRLIRLLAPRYRVFERLEQSVFGKDARTVILYLVENQKRVYQQIYHTAEERFRLLPPGISDDFRLPDADRRQELRQKVRTEFHVPEDAVLLIQVCSSFRTKGLDRVLHVLGALPETLQEKIVFLAVGKEKPGRYGRQAQRRGTHFRTVFTGPRSDVAELLPASDLMVHPARNEATGTVLAEAIACGLPSVCSGCCGYAPLVGAAGGFVLREPYSDNDLLRILESLLVSPSALHEIRRETGAFAATVDYHHRAECALNIIEETAGHV